MRKTIVLLLLVVLGVSVAAAFAGCGSSTSPQAKQTMATDLKNLQLDLTAMVNPNTYTSFDTFNTAWTKIQSDYNKVVTAAKSVSTADVNAVKSSYSDLKKAIGNASSNQSLQQKATAIITSGTALVISVQTLINSLNSTK